MKTGIYSSLGIVLYFAARASAQVDPLPDNTEKSIEEREVSWKQIAPNVLYDQRRIWLFPAHVATGSHWFPSFGVAGITAGLVAADPYEARYFRGTTSFHGFNRVFGSNATTAGILAVPAAFYLVGLTRKSSYSEHTGLLAAEAALDAEIPNLLLRTATRRLRPADVAPNGNFSDTWFDTGSNPLKAKGSFPSGHTASAFAVATVVARRYSNHRWVPFVAYGVAGLVAFSRVSLTTHFVSDVFFGGALGYSVGRFVVLRQ